MKLRPNWTLVGILLLGLGLRFWNLDAKPIWLDEVITALLSLGRSYYDVPFGSVFPVAALDRVLTFNPDTTCPQIVATVSTQSVHPPLFFCWMHNWMNWTQFLPQSWLWKLRALPALSGVVAIAALYQLNRVAFSRSAGLVGAALMAVSPFAVYLSQEARHYTLPIVLVILALLGLYQILLDLRHQQRRPAIWLGWIAINSLGFYVHYFFLLAFIAQAVTLIVCTPGFWRGSRGAGEQGSGGASQNSDTRLHAYGEVSYPPPASRLSPHLPIALALTAVCLTYLPWLPTLLQHLRRPETDWLRSVDPGWQSAIAPLYQLPISWIVMVISLPVEHQPIWVGIMAGLTMIAFVGWLGWQVAFRLRRLWQTPETQLATRMLGIYGLVVLLEFLAIVYILGKDITQVPRYSFIYFPAVCALLGASLSGEQAGRQPQRDRQAGSRGAGRRRFNLPFLRSSQQLTAIVLLTSLISSVLVVTNLTFFKPYEPDRVAKTFRVNPELPHLVAVAYSDWQDVALGLSFALALPSDLTSDRAAAPAEFVFLARSQPEKSYTPVWAALAQLKYPLRPVNFWLVGPGLRRRDFPEKLALATNAGDRQNCQRDPAHYYRRGIPYQLYRCNQ